ncbi:dihydropteroate synthase [Gluconobacter morbifer]|uniref:Dihydropteroate synthase n=1 Tax=Gluconobacter morbifer G707 TaxID=1088869 RepID=G6XFJ2_9PROT|nr:dihydropteroate synthase [Gluconobacter morbifer]EHH68949.1 dihydropteroate synthase [Gluconobacter morbifer G707]
MHISSVPPLRPVDWLRQRLASGPLVMGIVNLTPDSFSDGGLFQDPEAAHGQARRMLEEGAALVDLGAESTRPGFTPVPADEEWKRLAPAVRSLVADGATLSIDTTKAFVAREALAQGTMVINDVWGFQADAEMASVVGESDALAVLMHNRHERDEGLDLVADWMRFFDRSLAIARRAGISEDRLILDPGVGFGKTPAQNVQAVARLGELKRAYGLPVLLGLSRKSLFGTLLGRGTDERLAGTLAANLWGIRAGADIIRVHDVREHVDALKISAILEANA